MKKLENRVQTLKMTKSHQLLHVVFAVPSSDNMRDGLNHDIDKSLNASCLWDGYAFFQERIESKEMDTT